MEAKIKGKLMGLPIAAGARIMAINNSLTKAVPTTMEELEVDAKKITKPGKVYGLIMPGKTYTELTDFAYYFYSAGGDFFAVNADGSLRQVHGELRRGRQGSHVHGQACAQGQGGAGRLHVADPHGRPSDILRRQSRLRRSSAHGSNPP